MFIWTGVSTVFVKKICTSRSQRGLAGTAVGFVRGFRAFPLTVNIIYEALNRRFRLNL